MLIGFASTFVAYIRKIDQLVGQRTCYLFVGGSNPSFSTKIRIGDLRETYYIINCVAGGKDGIPVMNGYRGTFLLKGYNHQY